MPQISPKVKTMSLSPSSQRPRFLLDENVDRALEKFLKSNGFDTSYAPKGFSNGKLAEFSRLEKLVLVTNDDDFTNSELYTKDSVFSIVLLRIPQKDPEALLKAFSRMLKEVEEFEGYLIELTKEKSETFPLPTWTKYKFPK